MEGSSKNGIRGMIGTVALLLAAQGLIQPAFADTVTPLVHVTSDTFPGRYYKFGVVVDSQGDLTGISYSPGENDPAIYSLDQVRDGVVLYHNDSPSLDILKMSIDSSFSAQNGGNVQIDYMGSVIRPHTYGEFVVDLVRNGASWLPYEFSTSQGRAAMPFTQMNFVGNYSHLLGRFIGVSGVQVQ